MHGGTSIRGIMCILCKHLINDYNNFKATSRLTLNCIYVAVFGLEFYSLHFFHVQATVHSTHPAFVLTSIEECNKIRDFETLKSKEK